MCSLRKNKAFSVFSAIATGSTLCLVALVVYLLVPITREPVQISVPQDSVFARAEIWPNRLVEPGTFKLIIPWQRFQREVATTNEKPIGSYEVGADGDIYFKFWLSRGNGVCC